MAMRSGILGSKSVVNGALSPLQIEVVRKLIPIVRAGRWPIGGKISDAALAREFGISRTPVRQVLQFLAEKGLLAQTDNRGFVLVRLPTGDDRFDEAVPPSEMDTLYRQIMRARANGLIGSEASETELLEHFSTSRGVSASHADAFVCRRTGRTARRARLAFCRMPRQPAGGQ
ncbi:GntR family transcriptional regulator [Agrobacterium radiobacter]|uniref:GntR family transcriptional regulator n=1 Tax=Agrobacterium radiobacter TaxID=362 RepID=UPI003CE55364